MSGISISSKGDDEDNGIDGLSAGPTQYIDDVDVEGSGGQEWQIVKSPA